MDFTFRLATEADDADLRRLLATNAMPGQLTVTFEREPNYFLGCGTMGQFWQVLVGRHHPSTDIAAVLCRTVQSRFVNGRAEEVGYLGQLRVDAKYQGRWVLLHGIRALRELHADGRARVYLVAISDENVIARGVLIDHPRRGFPAMREMAQLYTLGIILRKRMPSAIPRHVAGIEISYGAGAELPRIVTFLREHGAKRQFFPAYEGTDFGSPTTRGFEARDFVVASKQGEIVGVIGLWDQSAFKQTVVQSYIGYLRHARPLYNLVAPLLGIQPLPGRGQHIHSAYASFICVRDDDPAVFRTLLHSTCQLAVERGHAYLMLGLAQTDPLLSVATRYPHIPYHSTLYLAFWEDERGYADHLDGRVPYIEIAAL